MPVAVILGAVVLETDVAEGSFPVVVTRREPGAVLVAVLDGSCSWGTGMEAASWSRDHLHDFLPPLARCGTDELRQSLIDLVASFPDDLWSDSLGPSISGLLVLYRSGEVLALGAGFYGVLIVGTGPPRRILNPPMLVDRLLEEGSLTISDVADFPYKSMATGPFLGETRNVPSHTLTSACEALLPSERVIVADRPTLDVLRARGRESTDLDAAAIRALAVEAGETLSSVVVLRERASAAEPQRRSTVGG